ncbi:hypothetical protein CPB83DRAFT_844444 [Crepidotus variabilis]|uniref:MARVEL domain-containing protein n=1 Tax=Crepidotus variabilis TaxID=179855 RepID=A0A9P6ERW0_9AGAR|nr:hypothetical protein CPB83DRAFT_844444 [Crepidotus variabilis]
MGLMDTFSEYAAKLAPSKTSKPLGGGIGPGGHGMVHPGDDMIVSKPTIVFHSCQIFFNFLALCCYASVASFQAKFGVGPSGLSGFAIFTSLMGILLSAFMLFVPVAYEKHDKFVRLASALKEVRVGFILTGTGITFSLLISFIVTISAFTQPGCKDPNNDPHAEEKGDAFKKGLSGWCITKKAAAIFFWLAFVFWVASVVVLVLDWRSGKLHAPQRRDEPFQPPARIQHDEEEGDVDADEDDDYEHIPPARRTTGPPAMGNNRYEDNSNADQSPFADPRYPAQTPLTYTPAPAGRASMDTYGAFSDPAPSGFGSSGYNNNNNSGRVTAPPTLPEPDFGQPMVSRTMQYADPYAAVRASIVGGGQSPTGVPPSYENSGYQGYR